MTQLLCSIALAAGALTVVLRDVLVDHGAVVRAVGRGDPAPTRDDPGASRRRHR